MTHSRHVLLTAAWIAGSACTSDDPAVTHQWSLDGLRNVESVVYDEKREQLYVSNGESYEEGISGFLSIITPQGSFKEPKWIDSLNRPTGMAIFRDRLYVADVIDVKIIDIESGQVFNQIEGPDEFAGLNDVTVSKEGIIYTTGSFTHAVYSFQSIDTVMTTFVQDTVLLKWANGIDLVNGKLLVGGEQLVQVDPKTGSVTPVSTSPSLRDIDGITSIHGGLLITTVDQSALWFVNKTGVSRQLIRDGSYFSDLTYVPKIRHIFVARGNHQEERYFLSAYDFKD